MVFLTSFNWVMLLTSITLAACSCIAWNHEKYDLCSLLSMYCTAWTVDSLLSMCFRADKRYSSQPKHSQFQRYTMPTDSMARLHKCLWGERSMGYARYAVNDGNQSEPSTASAFLSLYSARFARIRARALFLDGRHSMSEYNGNTWLLSSLAITNHFER